MARPAAKGRGARACVSRFKHHAASMTPASDGFAEADAAWRLACEEDEGAADEPADETIGSDDEDEWGVSRLEARLCDARARTIVLPSGDIHVCDETCPFAEEDKDGNVVCVHTGIVVCRALAARTDHSTGRSTWSSDPDMHSGVPGGGYGGGWIKKRDMMQASRSAYSFATTLDDTEMPLAAPVERAATAPRGAASKRGALCVDEAPPVDDGAKRRRASKRDCASRDARDALIGEAEQTLLELLGKRKWSARAAKSTPTIDPRLLDRELLFEASLRKYLKETLSQGGVPSIDDVHNISLAVERVIAEEKRKRESAASARGDMVSSVRFRERSARLVVSLWTGACQTPYLNNAKRGADSFRPFCAGALYAFKRGLSLSDGTVLVPRNDAFASALPSARDIAADAASKSLHASSHRGLCTIHRCIASVDLPTARRLFGDAIRSSRPA